MERGTTSLAVATMVLVARCICAGEPPRCSAWELVNPRPQANHLRDVAYGGGRWVAVGEGVAVVSTDAAAWSSEPLPGLSLRGVAYGNGVFVAVGADGVILRSTDGASWETIELPTEVALNAVAYVAGQFLAVGAGTTVLLSIDGIAWTSEHPAELQGDLLGVRESGTFNGKPGPMFLVWSSSSIALRRLDGSWLGIALPSDAVVAQSAFWIDGSLFATLMCAGYYCGSFEGCMMPQLLSATQDGVTWEQVCAGPYTGPFDVARYGNGVVGLVRYEGAPDVLQVWTSLDGRGWDVVQQVLNGANGAIESHGGTYVVVGDHGAIWETTTTATWGSASGPTADLLSLFWDTEAFAAIGRYTFLASPDGRQWHQVADAPDDIATAGPGRFLSLLGNRVFSSEDGLTWVEHDPMPLPASGAAGGLWDGRRFVVLNWKAPIGCRVTCFPSAMFAVITEDLASWVTVEQPRPFGVSSRLAMAYNGERYVAMDPARSWYPEPGRIAASQDGLTWQPVGATTGEAGMQSIASDGHAFTAVRGTSVLLSPDGLAWSTVDITPLHLVGVMWTGDEYVAVGDDGAGHAAIARSADGSAWTSEAYPAIPARLLAVAGGQRVQLAVGQAGVTLRRECHPQSPSRRLRGVH